MIRTTRKPEPASRPARRRWRVRGRVQGVGFRPFVYRLAMEMHITGRVRNEGDTVVIDAQADAATLRRFAQRLEREAPAMAKIDAVVATPCRRMAGERGFVIEDSTPTTAPPMRFAPDMATCPDCLTEMRETNDRRHGHAMINCTNCGPRYSIVRGVPYDRPSTTMAGFAMCPACRAAYGDPADRRFHAQPIACPDCGPRLSLADGRGRALQGEPIAEAAALLRAGKVLLIKGLGGFHLACRADDAAAVARMRRLKQRDAKPFAVMVRSIDAARLLVMLSDVAAALMTSPR